MKLRVKKLLNTRKGKPGVNAPKVSELIPGDIVDVIEKPLIGDPYDGNNLWYRDIEKDIFYWSGGLETMPIILPWWITNFGIDEIWKKTKGAGVTVAIIDSGIDSSHPDLSSAILSKIDATKPGGDAPDTKGHGTHCAGIIAAKGVAQVYGVAPECKLIVVKTMINGIIYRDLKKSFESLKNQQIDLISISGGINEDIAGFHELIQYFTNIEIPIVASIGNGAMSESNTGQFPARYPECISVGSLGENKIIGTDTFKNPIISLCAPGENILSCKPGNSYAIKSGSSMATAFTAGVLALLISDYKSQNRKLKLNEIKAMLNNSSDTATSNGFQYKIINPNKLFNKLTK